MVIMHGALADWLAIRNRAVKLDDNNAEQRLLILSRCEFGLKLLILSGKY
jgi:hypothetical protein